MKLIKMIAIIFVVGSVLEGVGYGADVGLEAPGSAEEKRPRESIVGLVSPAVKSAINDIVNANHGDTIPPRSIADDLVRCSEIRSQLEELLSASETEGERDYLSIMILRTDFEKKNKECAARAA